MDQPFYDALETRDPAERERSLMAALPRIIAAAKERAPAYRRLFAALRPEEVTDRQALSQLPLTRKSDLIELQRKEPPFGGFAAVPVSALRRVFVSPGRKPGGRISGGSLGHCSPPVSAPAISCTTPSRIT